MKDTCGNYQRIIMPIMKRRRKRRKRRRRSSLIVGGENGSIRPSFFLLLSLILLLILGIPEIDCDDDGPSVRSKKNMIRRHRNNHHNNQEVRRVAHPTIAGVNGVQGRINRRNLDEQQQQSLAVLQESYLSQQEQLYYLTTTVDADECGWRNTKQSDYRGTMSVTESGLLCQRWEDVDSSHTNIVTNDIRYRIQHGMSSNNYCRNPDDSSRVWCYINMGEGVYDDKQQQQQRWEYCDVPICEDLYDIDYEQEGDEYYYYNEDQNTEDDEEDYFYRNFVRDEDDVDVGVDEDDDDDDDDDDYDYNTYNYETDDELLNFINSNPITIITNTPSSDPTSPKLTTTKPTTPTLEPTTTGIIDSNNADNNDDENDEKSSTDAKDDNSNEGTNTKTEEDEKETSLDGETSDEEYDKDDNSHDNNKNNDNSSKDNNTNNKYIPSTSSNSLQDMGPMVGHTTHESVMLWTYVHKYRNDKNYKILILVNIIDDNNDDDDVLVIDRPPRLELTARQGQHNTDNTIKTIVEPSEEHNNGPIIATIDGLEPNTQYQYEMLILDTGDRVGIGT